MNKSVTGTGKTVEDAINDGLQQLGVTMDQVETNVLQVPDSGLMKLFGKKEAIVEVKLINDPQQRAFDFLNEVFNAMKVSCNIQMRLEDSILFINLEGKDMGVLIGRLGQTLY